MPALTLNKYYNLSLYQNPVLGTTFKNLKLVSILDYNTALKFSNIELLHRQIYPYLPPGTNSDQTTYTYYLFSYKDVDITIADVWIIPDSIEETSGLNYTIRLNNVTSSQLSVVRDQLRLLGIEFTVDATS